MTSKELEVYTTTTLWIACLCLFTGGSCSATPEREKVAVIAMPVPKIEAVKHMAVSLDSSFWHGRSCFMHPVPESRWDDVLVLMESLHAEKDATDDGYVYDTGRIHILTRKPNRWIEIGFVWKASKCPLRLHIGDEWYCESSKTWDRSDSAIRFFNQLAEAAEFDSESSP